MKHWLLSYAILIALMFLIGHEWSRLPDGNLRMALLDVGQGDAILITTPGNQRILIDGGPDLTLLERLGEELPFLDRRIDLMILSHTDLDHIASLPSILHRYDVRRILMTGAQKSSSIYQAFLVAAETTGTQIIIAQADQDLDLGEGVVLDILWPMKSLFQKEVEDHNNASVVAKLIWKDHSIFLTGDIEKEVEESLLAEGYDLTSDILKVPHHGSRTSSSTGFLLAVRPELALISVGKDNQFGHPHREIIERYQHMNIPIRRTDEEGRVEVVLE